MANVPSTRSLANAFVRLSVSSPSQSGPLTVRFASTYSQSSSSGSSSSAYQRSRTPRLPPTSLPSPREKPTSTAYYTGRPAYIDTLLDLEDLTRQTKRALEQAQLLSPNSAPPSLAAAGSAASSSRQNLWISARDLQASLGSGLKAAQYRQIVSRLGLLARYATLIHQLSVQNPSIGVEGGLLDRYNNTLERFMNENAKSQSLLAEKDSDKVFWEQSNKKVDGSGRAYSAGRRKESSAQVWIIRSKNEAGDESGEPQTGKILINNQSLPEYFTRVAEREIVTWPLKITSNLGAYNVFALTRGGGKSGQAGAIAHALANAIVAETAHNLDFNQGLPLKRYVKDILAKDGVLKRDPRMVERKKTGLAKARKAYTWVKR